MVVGGGDGGEGARMRLGGPRARVQIERCLDVRESACVRACVLSVFCVCCCDRSRVPIASRPLACKYSSYLTWAGWRCWSVCVCVCGCAIAAATTTSK